MYITYKFASILLRYEGPIINRCAYIELYITMSIGIRISRFQRSGP